MVLDVEPALLFPAELSVCDEFVPVFCAPVEEFTSVPVLLLPVGPFCRVWPESYLLPCRA